MILMNWRKHFEQQALSIVTSCLSVTWARIFETKIAVVYCESQDLDVTRQYTTDLVFSKRCLSQNSFANRRKHGQICDSYGGEASYDFCHKFARLRIFVVNNYSN